MKRLSDDELNELCALVDAARYEGDEHGEAVRTIDDFFDRHCATIATELRSLRLSTADVEALRHLARDVREFGVGAPDRRYRSRDEEHTTAEEWTKRCADVLSRLIAASEVG
jgi:hypothetical protein